MTLWGEFFMEVAKSLQDNDLHIAENAKMPFNSPHLQKILLTANNINRGQFPLPPDHLKNTRDNFRFPPL
jgi:hypothetical protein